MGITPAQGMSGSRAARDAAAYRVGGGQEGCCEMPFGLGMVVAEVPGHPRMHDPISGLTVAVGVVADEGQQWLSRGSGWRRTRGLAAGGEACWKLTSGAVSCHFKDEPG